MLIWRRGRIRLSRSTFACFVGMIFGLCGSAVLSTFGDVPHSLYCDTAMAQRKSPQLLFVGIMTAAKYIDTRAYNIWKTWAKQIPGQVVFFVSEHATSIHKDMPVVKLKGVDDVYPPQKKSFAMMKWMADNHLDDFNWFMRSDDDLYVRGDRLEKLLRSLDSDKAHMIGQAGLGNSAEYGLLSLGQQDNYCMGGPGVVLSREALRAVAPHLQSCLAGLLTTHEDVELGRCVRKHVGVACTWNYEMQTLFHNNQTVPNAYEEGINQLRHAITLHPIKRPSVMLRVHSKNRALRLVDLYAKRISLLEELPETTKTTSLTRHIATTTNDLYHWNYIASNNILFCADQVDCPRHTVDLSIRNAIHDVVTNLFDEFNSNARQRGRVLQFQALKYGYMRVEPRFGVDYVLDMILLFKKFRPPHRATISVRRHAYVLQKFGKIEAISDDLLRNQLRQRIDKIKRSHRNETMDVDGWLPAVLAPENSRVNIILPLAGRADTFKRFAEHLRNVCQDRSIFSLIVVLFKTGTVEDTAVVSTLRSLQSEIDLRVVDLGLMPFSRGLALAKGAETLQSTDLMFFTDVDMLFTCDALHRIRLNTILGAQVYFPIVFSEYSPETWSDNDHLLPDAFHYGRRRGYFRHFGFGLASLYKSDLDLVGGLNVNIKGWGLEDVDLFEKCVKSPLRIIRAPDPGLVHIYHPIHCPSTMPPAQYVMCVGSKAASLASLDSLVDQISIFS
ncbi:hypothetical protein AB6A40_002938 [Gnathostoma spinigerum]|uniref:Hexosyltransferase n=1 Tax=Gnathostoma spinigerum TaxID=75299 RepID=A0ABD6E822_9BILA